jgi:hypothetical protein
MTASPFDALAPLYRERARLLNRILRGEATQADHEALARVRAELEEKEAATMRQTLDAARKATEETP